LRCAACALVLAAIVAAPASAAFPGRDGLLAVQPVTGAGVLLVNAHGGSEHRICTNRSQCGSPKDPRWSPDGLALAFNASTVHLIYPDGSCLDCQMGGASTPAFTANPTLVTFESGGALVEDGIDGLPKATIVKGQFSDAVWSVRGELAVVRGGSVWAGSPHRLHRIGTGSAPSWSPGGLQLALVRKGWLVVVGLRRRSVRRLVRGTAPAWSPNGTSIAFIGAGHRLSVVPAFGGSVHRVGSVRGVSVDWQPVTKKAPAGCLAPAGSKVIASSASAVVTSVSNSVGSAYIGCLRADGRERVLRSFTNSPEFGTGSVSAAAVGGNYAALAVSALESDLDGVNDNHFVEVFDLRTGEYARNLGGEAVYCSSNELLGENCSNSDINRVVVGADGVSAAHIAFTYPPGLNAFGFYSVSCPSASLCVAVDGNGHLFTSTNPTGGAWMETNLPDLLAVSCPSASLCVGVTQGISALGEPTSVIYTSTDPTGGAGAWTAGYTEQDDGDMSSVDCPSVSLCVAIDDSGNVVTSTDPTGGAAAWTAANVDGSALAGISCPSVSLCVATDGDGHVITSTNPSGGAGAWQTVNAVAAGTVGPKKLSCPSTTLCVGLGPNLEVLTSTNPTDADSWTSTTPSVAVNAIDCPTTSLCVAVGDLGALDVSTDPASGEWTSSQIDGEDDLWSISCASSSLCVAGDGDNDLVSTSNPIGGSAAWSSVMVEGNACAGAVPGGTSCTTEQIIADDGTGLHTLDTTNEPATDPPMLTGLTLSGDTVTWDLAGTPESAVLHSGVP